MATQHQQAHGSGTLFVLGAADPEMHAIEELLAGLNAPFVFATVGAKRVYPGNAYRAAMPAVAMAALHGGEDVYLVECIGDAPRAARRIDHHRPGDPGYGRPPAGFWAASSIGQTVAALHARLAREVEVTPAMRLVAAADHCLGAAYRGECPGIEPGALLAWHVASRAAFERRSGEALLCDVEASRSALRHAPRVLLAADVEVADMRTQAAPELLLAAAREGQCCLSAVTARDGRTKIGCLVGSPRQVSAFMQSWAPAQHLVDIYGDPVRGFAGAYIAAATPD
ncbi:MAG: hypothetical protein J0H50_12040 [Xanthomonadales bacterium]|nr:hypothetical protein [Xanthomonadales bacterium]